jgi:uncharacterized protein YbjT (DUF2867 family)
LRSHAASTARNVCGSTQPREMPVAQLDRGALTRLVRVNTTDVVVNCLGLLQPGERARDIRQHFIERLLAALRDAGRPVLLAHLSIPGATADDSTEFACSKRDAERAIAESGIPYAILRPGFVLAPVDQVRIGDQSQDCQGTWSHHSA